MFYERVVTRSLRWKELYCVNDIGNWWAYIVHFGSLSWNKIRRLGRSEYHVCTLEITNKLTDFSLLPYYNQKRGCCIVCKVRHKAISYLILKRILWVEQLWTRAISSGKENWEKSLIFLTEAQEREKKKEIA